MAGKLDDPLTQGDESLPSGFDGLAAGLALSGSVSGVVTAPIATPSRTASSTACRFGEGVWWTTSRRGTGSIVPQRLIPPESVRCACRGGTRCPRWGTLPAWPDAALLLAQAGSTHKASPEGEGGH